MIAFNSDLVVHVDLENLSYKKLPDLSKFLGTHLYIVTYNKRVLGSDDKYRKLETHLLNTYPSVYIQSNVVDKPIKKDLCDNYIIDFMVSHRKQLSNKLNILYTTDKGLIERSKEINPDILAIHNNSPKYRLDTKISVKKFASKYNKRLLSKEDTHMDNHTNNSFGELLPPQPTQPTPQTSSTNTVLNYSFAINTDTGCFDIYKDGTLIAQHSIPKVQKGRIYKGVEYHPIIPFTPNIPLPSKVLQDIKTTIPIKPLFNNLYELTYKSSTYIFYLTGNEYSLVSNPDDVEVFSMLLVIGLLPYGKPLEVTLPTKPAITSHLKFVHSKDSFTLNLQVNYTLDYNFVNKLKVGLSKDGLTRDVGFVAYLPIGKINIPVITRGENILIEATESSRKLLNLITGGL